MILTLSPRQQNLLALFEKNTRLSFREIKQYFQSVPDRSIQADLGNLKQAGLINSEGHGRGAYWVTMKSK